MSVAADLDAPPKEESLNAAKVVWGLAWPAVALNSLQVINNLLDRGFIGHLEASAVTAQGAAINIMFLMFSIAMAIATGATALVSRAYGAEDHAEYRTAARQSFRLGLIGGVGLGVTTALIANPVAKMLIPSLDKAAVNQMTQFVLAYSIGLPAISVIQVLAGSLRGIGDTKSPMVISGLQIFLHIALNFVLIFPARKIGGIHLPGANLGLTGAGLALSGSAWMSAIGYSLFISKTPLGPVVSFQFPEREWMVRILRIAIPAALMACLRVFSLTAFTMVLRGVAGASAAIGAMGTAFALESVMFMPAFGLSTAAGALVGQSLGAKRPDRAERLAWTAGHHAAIVTIALCGPVFFLAPNIAHVMLEGKEAITTEVVTLLRWLCATEVFFAYAMVMIGAMQGAGETKGPLWISIICLWGMRVPLAWFLALHTGLGTTGAWISMAFTQGVQGVLAMMWFKMGRWKTQRV